MRCSAVQKVAEGIQSSCKAVCSFVLQHSSLVLVQQTCDNSARHPQQPHMLQSKELAQLFSSCLHTFSGVCPAFHLDTGTKGSAALLPPAAPSAATQEQPGTSRHQHHQQIHTTCSSGTALRKVHGVAAAGACVRIRRAFSPSCWCVHCMTVI